MHHHSAASQYLSLLEGRMDRSHLTRRQLMAWLATRGAAVGALGSGGGWSAPSAQRTLASTLANQSSGPDSDPVFNVHDFGAVGDGQADDAEAIRSAIAIAIEAGAGSDVPP